MTESSVALSVIVPIFNEGDVLWEMAERLAPYLDSVVGAANWQYVLVDNGSKDNSPEIINQIIERWPPSIECHLELANYGDALYAGLENADGTYAYIINVDFWDVVFLEWAWHHKETYDLILGSKRADPCLNRQTKFRRTLSWGLNTLLQFVFGFVGTDTHGQKFLNLSSMRRILKQCVMRRGQFDTEFTLKAMRQGLWMAEVPVPIVEERKQRNFMVKKILQNIYDIFRLRNIMKEVPFSGTIRYHRWARQDMEDERRARRSVL